MMLVTVLLFAKVRQPLDQYLGVVVPQMASCA